MPGYRLSRRVAGDGLAQCLVEGGEPQVFAPPQAQGHRVVERRVPRAPVLDAAPGRHVGQGRNGAQGRPGGQILKNLGLEPGAGFGVAGLTHGPQDDRKGRQKRTPGGGRADQTGAVEILQRSVEAINSAQMRA